MLVRRAPPRPPAPIAPAPGNRRPDRSAACAQPPRARLDNAAHGAFERNHCVDERIAFEQRRPARPDHPGHVAVREAVLEAGDGGQRVNHIAHGAQPDDENAERIRMFLRRSLLARVYMLDAAPRHALVVFLLRDEFAGVESVGASLRDVIDHAQRRDQFRARAGRAGSHSQESRSAPAMACRRCLSDCQPPAWDATRGSKYPLTTVAPRGCDVARLRRASTILVSSIHFVYSLYLSRSSAASATRAASTRVMQRWSMGHSRFRHGLHSTGSRTTRASGPVGPVATSSVAPKTATVGTPSAEAMCIAPESLVRYTRQAAAKSMNSASDGFAREISRRRA